MPASAGALASESTMRLYRLNVARSTAGKVIPFDRVYLANGQNRRALKRLFEYAIVMPLAGELAAQLRACLPKRVTTVNANDRLSNAAKEPLDQLSWDALLASANDWIVVTPILPKVARDLRPSYLANNSWYTRSNWKERREKNPLPGLSYLQTPQENFRPVCVACPRFTEHMAGNCQPGQKICLTSLVLGTPITTPDNEVNDFREVQLG